MHSSANAASPISCSVFISTQVFRELKISGSRNVALLGWSNSARSQMLIAIGLASDQVSTKIDLSHDWEFISLDYVPSGQSVFKHGLPAISKAWKIGVGLPKWRRNIEGQTSWARCMYLFRHRCSCTKVATGSYPYSMALTNCRVFDSSLRRGLVIVFDPPTASDDLIYSTNSILASQLQSHSFEFIISKVLSLFLPSIYFTLTLDSWTQSRQWRKPNRNFSLRHILQNKRTSLSDLFFVHSFRIFSSYCVTCQVPITYLCGWCSDGRCLRDWHRCPI